MAEQKQYWKDALRSAKQEGDRQDDRADKARKKKIARQMYLRRKLDKDIKKLINKNVIRFGEIVEIHRRHSVNVLEGPLRGEDSVSHEDA